MSDSLPISRRRDLGLGATLAAGVGLSACGEGGDKGGSATAKASQLNLDTLSGEITFQAQGLKGTFDGFFNDLIKKFEKEHSGCTIKWTDLPGTDDFDTTMVTQASNGTMADVVNMPSSTIMALSRADYLLDIETSVPGIGDKFVPDVWGKLKLGKDNEHTALPWYFGPFVVTYNKDIFKDVGLDPEIPPKTMTEYLDFAKKITAAGKQAVYGNTSWYMLAEWRALGVKVMNDDFTKFTFASESNALLWLTTMADMYAKGEFRRTRLPGASIGPRSTVKDPWLSARRMRPFFATSKRMPPRHMPVPVLAQSLSMTASSRCFPGNTSRSRRRPRTLRSRPLSQSGSPVWSRARMPSLRLAPYAPRKRPRLRPTCLTSMSRMASAPRWLTMSTLPLWVIPSRRMP